MTKIRRGLIAANSTTPLDTSHQRGWANTDCFTDSEKDLESWRTFFPLKHTDVGTV